ncbi:MAG TPA: type 2 isopentenyl-diphosphate Delta-isomerase [Methanocorpusculum sp.]|nr:type 2 isopentenyl-diphosphate Delta-isomerase [Methanocorpusculum sp.]
MTELTSSRKLDHLRLARDADVTFGDAGFDDIILKHNALPECSLDEIDTSAGLFDRRFSLPLFIEAITGGHPDTREVNRVLAAAAEKYTIPMGVGSQRAALENPALADSFTIVRDTAPHAFLCANLGAVQLVQHGMEWVDQAVEMIEADAVCIHLNFLQEALQPEGDHDARGVLSAVAEACRESKVPVIVKETGCGISDDVIDKFITDTQEFAQYPSAFDIGGFGGTSWAKIEGLRAAGDKTLESASRTFLNWGIPTVVSIFEVANSTLCPVIASGGLMSGLDIAKALAIGADFTGMALRLVKPALSGEAALNDTIEQLRRELKTAMFLTGSKNITALQDAAYYVTGRVREMTRR